MFCRRAHRFCIGLTCCLVVTAVSQQRDRAHLELPRYHPDEEHQLKFNTKINILRLFQFVCKQFNLLLYPTNGKPVENGG